MVLAGDDSLLDHGIIRTRPNTDIATGTNAGVTHRQVEVDEDEFGREMVSAMEGAGYQYSRELLMAHLPVAVAVYLTPERANLRRVPQGRMYLRVISSLVGTAPRAYPLALPRRAPR